MYPCAVALDRTADSRWRGDSFVLLPLGSFHRRYPHYRVQEDEGASIPLVMIRAGDVALGSPRGAGTGAPAMLPSCLYQRLLLERPYEEMDLLLDQAMTYRISSQEDRYLP